MEEATARLEHPLGAIRAADPAEREHVLSTMLSMRIIHLFSLLRRSSGAMQPRGSDLSRLEWRIMTQLDGVRPLSLTALADRLILDRGQLSRTVKAMVERGLLTRSRKRGGPEIEINLSAAGLDIRSAMVDRAGDRDRLLTEGLDPEDLAAAFRVVEHMICRAASLEDDLALTNGSD